MNEGEHMMHRVYTLLAVVLCVVLAGCFLVGCFGFGDEPTSVTSATTVPSESTESTVEPVTTTEYSELVDGLPRAFVESLGTRPIVVLFYVPGGVDDERVLKAVSELQGIYSNYTFLVFDYGVPSAYGDLSQVLSVGYPPNLVLIDRHGDPQTIWSGYVDKGTLNQSLINLGRD